MTARRCACSTRPRAATSSPAAAGRGADAAPSHASGFQPEGAARRLRAGRRRAVAGRAVPVDRRRRRDHPPHLHLRARPATRSTCATRWSTPAARLGRATSIGSCGASRARWSQQRPDERRAVQLPGRGVVQRGRQVREAQVRRLRRATARSTARSPAAGSAMLQHHFFAAWIPQADQAALFSLDHGDGQLRHRDARSGRSPSRRVARRQHAGAPVGRPEAGRPDRGPGRAGPGPRGGLQPLQHLRDPGQLAVLAARCHPLAGRQLGLGDRRPGGGDQGCCCFRCRPRSTSRWRKMRKFQPRIAQLKERYGDDKQKFQMAMMELYKKEKINPVGGCLPILVQMPVFLALYWVLLESVELRHAPWILVDQRPHRARPVLHPAGHQHGGDVGRRRSSTPMVGMDPMQQKMMQFMPLVFGVMFAFFPAGLVLYWVTNGALGLLQQWWMTRNATPRRRPRPEPRTTARSPPPGGLLHCGLRHTAPLPCHLRTPMTDRDTIAAIATAAGRRRRRHRAAVGAARARDRRRRRRPRRCIARRARVRPLPRRRRRHHRRRHRAVFRRAGQLHRRGRGRAAGAWQPGGAAAAGRRAAVALGARRARPGEFSERAFLNGKLDLAQAEAVADLIAAGDVRAARAARRALDGEFSRRVEALADAVAGDPRSTSRRRSISPTNRIDTLGGDRLQARPGRDRRRAGRAAARCRTRPAPARRPARGDRRPAQRRQEFAAQCAGRQRPRHRHRHRRHHPRPAARSGAHRRRRADPGRHRRPARGRRRDRARGHAPRTRANWSAPTWRSWCSMRATRRRAAMRWRTPSAGVPRRSCGCTTRPTCCRERAATSSDRDATAPGDVFGRHDRPRARCPARAPAGTGCR